MRVLWSRFSSFRIRSCTSSEEGTLFGKMTFFDLMFSNITFWFWLKNGVRPNIISYSTIPSAQMSLADPYGSPQTTSGDR